MKKDISYLPDFYKGYTELVKEDSIIDALKESGLSLTAFLSKLNEEQGKYSYGAGKWTVKGVVGHIIDVERIFCARALRIARDDKTTLPGFDENAYAEASNADSRTLAAIVNEFKNIRVASIDLFESFHTDWYNRFCESNGEPISLKALGYIIAGHSIHHYNILRERYTL